MAQDVSRLCHPLPASKPSSTSRRAATISAIRIKALRIRITQITNIDKPKSHGQMKGPSKGSFTSISSHKQQRKQYPLILIASVDPI